MRGWITQQLRTLTMPRIVGHDIILNIDSDVVFIRRFTLDMLFDDNRLGLFEVDYCNPEIKGWAAIAASAAAQRTAVQAVSL